MADYFTHFSCLLDVGTPENAARALDLYNRLSEDGASEEPPSEGFLLSIQPEHGGTQLWMRDDVTGDPERLIQFVKRCAAEFGLTGRWGFQYANTCSKPRLDGFGGGAHVLDLATGETVDWIYTDGWLAETIADAETDMSIPPTPGQFQTLLRAAGDGNLALMECLDAVTGSCALRHLRRGAGRWRFRLHTLRPSRRRQSYDAYLPPDPDPEGFVHPDAGEMP
jgi:hypothetical protein